jgi:hypothetical protein
MIARRTIERKMGAAGPKFAFAALAIPACIFAQTQAVSESISTGQQFENGILWLLEKN